MKYKFISDSHTHSENSFDGNDSVIMMCERAANLGLYSLTVTDHCECNEYYGNSDNTDYRKCIENSIRDTAKARAMYIDRVSVYTGIELGQPCQDRKAAEEVLSLAEYDFVIGSLHNLRGERD
ncbi:MAG: PHP domain-containing protein, partial [Clostridia bacterium]|nr:PHP domain-containing protein [Clostridia bacterium]